MHALHKALSDVMSEPAARAQLEQLGGTVPPMLPLADLAKGYQSQTARFRAIANVIKLEAP